MASRGLYRRMKVAKDGILRGAGAYVLDMRIKNVPEFAGMNLRLAKTTEVYPGDRNAETIVGDMKLMVKELIRDRNVVALQQIQGNKLSLQSAYKKWRTGRIHLAEQYEDQSIVKLWLAYYSKAVVAEVTRVNRQAVVAALKNHRLLADSHVLNELPERLRAIRQHYEKQRQHPAFNTIRIELLSFLKKGLGYDESSLFFQEVKKIPKLKQLKGREHHPFDTPRDLASFCENIRKRFSPSAKFYADCVMFMCLHGLRPHEFTSGYFSLDAATGHLRVKGTKNENADRVVPLMMAVDTIEHPPKIDTLNRSFERMSVSIRCRDFRRTYAVWTERAGIVASRIQAYMGHGDRTITRRYQRIVPKASTLDEDRDRLRTWIEDGLRQPAGERTTPRLMSSFRMLLTASAPTRAELLRRVREQDAADTPSESAILKRRRRKGA
jgi:hypothetical protein